METGDAPLRVLVISPRVPADGGKGDQLRALQLIRALAATHTVEVLTTGAGSRGGDVGANARLIVRRVTPLERLAGAVGAVLRGQPFQVGWMMPGSAWRTARRRAARADVVVAVTVRALRGRLPVPVILDHVDALSVNMRRRAGGPEPIALRLFAKAEAVLLDRWERRLARCVAVQAAISPVDASQLPTPPEVHVIPNSVAVGGPFADIERDIDVVLTGNMAYPPNADAARWLSDEIAPALWRRRPGASVWVVGRDARRLTLDGRIRVAADVPAVAPYLRRARVALAPLRIGTGAPNKVLEAIAAGAAVVATPAAIAPFDLTPTAVLTGEDAEALAAAAERLLGDDRERRRLVERALRVVGLYSADAQRTRIEALLYEALG
jgi:glycosyltransferase involved in cell wall biosynthesis